MDKHFFHSKKSLQECVTSYFNYIAGEYHLEQLPVKGKEGLLTEQRVWDRDPEPPTLSGLAYWLGLNSRGAYIQYEQEGKYSEILKRARLRIEAEYEKKLHQQSATGAIFALKAMGWNEKTDLPSFLAGNVKIEIVDTQFAPASSEKEVIINL
ncbi:DNA-packaging protein [Mucilaginibacter sp. RS28]|uniref:DNA-packaging protein n=1 Tax=Mucilaginibacter straminoryzae TaxID=2932774 RepID=A0A9X1X017_9SPHI|nr:DNA-packaging protein [Mucilaginibacter straminoryzae]MCJ8208674.1 DNA-packaging protein [Mucilaginibacter straminoryzae]